MIISISFLLFLIHPNKNDPTGFTLLISILLLLFYLSIKFKDSNF